MTSDDAIEAALDEPIDFQLGICSRSTFDPSGCWLWRGSRSDRGYGLMKAYKKQVYAHRVSWAVFNGRSPRGLCICHTCDEPQCVNPEHLWSGTRADNNRDMELKGRRANAPAKNPRKGTDASWSILSERQVAWIRQQRRDTGARYSSLAYALNVPVRTVSNAATGFSWKHLNDIHPPATTRPWPKKGKPE